MNFEVAMTDERKGLPSASSIERLALCPGSWQLERTMPPDEGSSDSEKGDRIHRALAGEPGIELDDAEERTFEACKAQAAKIIEDEFGDEQVTIEHEKRIWGRDAKSRELVSAKLDLLAYSKKKGVVIDYKTLYGDHEQSPTNLQIRCQIVLAAKEHRLQEMVGAIIQPNVRGTPALVHYGAPELRQASFEIAEIIREGRDIDARRVAGEKQCKFCRARSVCPESTAKLKQLSTFDAPKALSIPEIPAKLLAEYLDASAVAEALIKSFRDSAKARIANGETIPGYILEEGDVREKINDIQTVWKRARLHGVSMDAFQEGCTITKKSLTELLKKSSGLRGKSLEQLVKQTFEDCVEAKPNAPSLTKVRNQIE